MERRTFLATAGAGTVGGLAGCLGDGASSESAEGPPGSHRDGYPPASVIQETPAPPSADPESFETVVYEGTAVPLAPVDVVIDWYRRRAARVADARSATAYRRAHVTGAVLSPAPDGQSRDDPVRAWPADDRIVTYCGCPHHLSSMRAAALIEAGYKSVFALDEGFGAWYERGYPVSGTAVGERPERRVIEGRTGPGDAGGDAWVRHVPTGQREAAPIGSDGRYVLSFRFARVSASSSLVVETPSYTVTDTLAALTSGVVGG